RSGDHMSALRVYRQARERDPDNLGALLGEGDSMLEIGAVQEAERRYRAALAVDPRNGRAQGGLARALVRQSRAEEALPLFEAAVAQGRATAELLNHYGVALDLLGRHDEAQVQYGGGLDLAPQDSRL